MDTEDDDGYDYGYIKMKWCGCEECQNIRADIARHEMAKAKSVDVAKEVDEMLGRKLEAEKTFWTVWVPSRGGLSGRYELFPDAQNEALRRSKEELTDVYVMQMVGKAESRMTTVWREGK